MKILPVIVVMLATFVSSGIVYNRIIAIEIEACWDRLENVTQSMVEKIQIRITDNINVLVRTADSIILHNDLKNEEVVAEYLGKIRDTTIFDRVDIVFPNNTVLMSDGIYREVEYPFPFEEVVEQGIHISQRYTDEYMNMEVLYCSVPIVDKKGVLGILRGVINCNNLSDSFPIYIYNGAAEVFIVDSVDGNCLMDSLHTELGNIYEMDLPERLKGYEAVDFLKDISEGKPGKAAFVSETNSRAGYITYMPIKDFNWSVSIMAHKNEIFANLCELQDILVVVAIIETVLLLAYLIWNIFVAYTVISSEEHTHQMELLRVANMAKEQFISRMSHDIRTPLNGIVGMLEIMEKHEDEPERVKDCRKKIQISTKYLMTLANDVLDMNEMESGKLQVVEERIDLKKLLQELEVIVCQRAMEADVSYHYAMDEVLHPVVKGCNAHMQRVLVNLITNAIKYNKAGGSVSVLLEEEPMEKEPSKRLYRFRVTDTGIGMSEEFQKNMFAAFEQEVSDARSENQGYGLGLSIVARLVDKMQGKIEVESEKNVGSCFTVLLPLTILEDAEEAAEKKIPVHKDLKGTTILFVEDNEMNMEIGRELLTDIGAKVITAVNGKEAVTIFRQSEPYSIDVILMDIMMPEMDGLEATRIIRALERTDAEKVPIFAMTATTFADDVARCKDAGMNEHIAKPLHLDIVISNVIRYRDEFRGLRK